MNPPVASSPREDLRTASYFDKPNQQQQESPSLLEASSDSDRHHSHRSLETAFLPSNSGIQRDEPRNGKAGEQSAEQDLEVLKGKGIESGRAASAKNPITTEMAFSLRKEILARDINNAMIGNMRHVKTDRFSPILEEDFTGKSPRFEPSFLSPLIGIESASTESTKTIKWSSMPHTPNTNQPSTPSYPFPPMNAESMPPNETMTPALHRPFTALSPTISPSQTQLTENQGTRGKLAASQSVSAARKAFLSLGNLPAGTLSQEQGPDLHDITLKLQSEPGLEKWWSNVSEVLRLSFGASRATLAIPSDSTDVENVPWAQMATFNANNDDPYSSGNTKDTNSGATDFSGQDEIKSEISPTAREKATELVRASWIDVPASRPRLESRHSFAGFPQKSDPVALESMQIFNDHPQRPAASRANSHMSLRGGLPSKHEFQGTKLSSESLKQYLAAQPDKKSQTTELSFNTHEREIRARILPVLQMLEMEPDPLLNSVGAVRVLERGKLVHIIRDYSDALISADRGHNGGTESHEHRTFWPTPNCGTRRTNVNPSEKNSRSPLAFGSRSVKRPFSYTSGSSISSSGPGNSIKDEWIEKPARTLPYEDYEQISPSPWSQSPAPSPAVQDDQEVNPFFANVQVDEEAFSEDPPAHDYTSERQIESIGIDRANSILHIPLVHPIISKSKRQQRLREFSGKKTKRKVSGNDTSSATHGNYYRQASHSSFDDDRRTPIAILSIMSPIVPYPSSLSSSLNFLAPHLATSFYNARQHSDLQNQIAGMLRHHNPNQSSERRGSNHHGDFSSNEMFSPPSTESIASTSEYSGISMHSPRGSNVGTPGWDSSGQAPDDEQPVNKSQPDSTSDVHENYFGSKKRYNNRRTTSGSVITSRTTNTPSIEPSGMSMNTELVQGPVIKSDQKILPSIESRPHPAASAPRPLWRAKTTSTIQREEFPTLLQPSIDQNDRIQPEGQDKATFKRDASPNRYYTEVPGSPRRQAMFQASGRSMERPQPNKKQLHTHGANFVATNPSLPTASAKVSSITPEDSGENAREEDFTFRPPTSSMMRIMIDSGAIQEFIAEPITGKICWANSRFQTYRNESAAQIRQKPWDAIHPKDQKTFRKAWTNALHTGDQVSHQVRLQRFDGQYRWFHIRIVPIKDSYSSIKHWHGQAMDIHEQHIAEVNAAREKEKATSESKYRSLANSNPHIIFAASVPEGMTFANTQWLSYSGQSFDDALGFGFLDHVHPDDIIKCQFPAISGTTDVASPKAAVSRFRSDGHGDGSSSSTDISEASATTDETMKARSPGSTYEGTSGSVHVLAPSGLLRNLAAKGIVKASKDGQGRLSITSEMRLKSQSGHYRWHLVQGSLIESVNFGKGEAQWIIACADISDQKHIEEKLKDANTTLESETTRKMQFLSTMSHEIRTPLNGIIGNLQFLLNSNLDDYQAEWTYGADAAARGMHDLINDILDVSKAEAKMLTLYYDWFHIRSIIEDVFETLASKANEKRLELCYFVDKDVPSNIKGDAGRIRQVLLNLVSNAIKFTQRGEICVDCKIKRISIEEAADLKDSDEVNLIFNVQDTGSGFTEDDAKILFRPYSQIDNSSTRNNGGTGLGLLLCKQMVELHHGEISAYSTPGKGSTFTFSARFKLPTGNDRPKAPRDPSLEDAQSSPTRGRKQVFGRGLVTSPGELLTKVETLESSGSSDPSVASSLRAAHRSLRSSASSMDSVENVASLNLVIPSKQSNIKKDINLISEAVAVIGPELLHPPTYSILIVCPQEHTRRTTEIHIREILPQSIPAQVSTSEDVEASHRMMSGEEPIKFTHVVLQLHDVVHILAFMDLMLNSKVHLQTCIVIITNQAQQMSIMAGQPSLNYDQLRANRRLFFLLKPAKPPKFAKIFDPQLESALSKDHSRANRMENTDIQKQAFQKFQDTLGNRGLRVLAVEDNKLNMKVCGIL